MEELTNGNSLGISHQMDINKQMSARKLYSYTFLQCQRARGAEGMPGKVNAYLEP